MMQSLGMIEAERNLAGSRGKDINPQTRLAIAEVQDQAVKKDLGKVGLAAAMVIPAVVVPEAAQALSESVAPAAADVYLGVNVPAVIWGAGSGGMIAGGWEWFDGGAPSKTKEGFKPGRRIHGVVNREGGISPTSTGAEVGEILSNVIVGAVNGAVVADMLTGVGPRWLGVADTLAIYLTGKFIVGTKNTLTFGILRKTFGLS